MSGSISRQPDDLAEDRDAKFKAWLQKKSLRDKAFEYIVKLDPTRAEKEESLKEVAIALCAVDRLIGDDPKRKKQDAAHDPYEAKVMNKNKHHRTSKSPSVLSATTAPPPQKTLRSAWLRWAMEHHTFEMVQLSQGDYDTFSGAVREFLKKLSEVLSEGYPGASEAARGVREGEDPYILLSLKYSFPAVPKANENPKPLSGDQKQQNTMFQRECNRVWIEAKRELDLRVEEFVRRKENESIEAERKGKATASGANSARSLRPRLVTMALNDLSLKRLKEWIEIDEDKKAEAERKALQEKQYEAKKNHEEFVKKKDSLRIRLPDPSEFPKKPVQKMSCGSGAPNNIRPQVQVGAKTTVELMMNSGLKYVHASSKGRSKGMHGDLEKSRKMLLEMGVVLKDNFDSDGDSDSEFAKHKFREQKENNPVILERIAQEQRARQESAHAYEEWVTLKGLKEQALRYLASLQAPEVAVLASGSSVEGGLGRMTASVAWGAGGSSARSRSVVIAEDKGIRQIIEVGRALKRVDRSLLQEWVNWSLGARPPPPGPGEPIRDSRNGNNSSAAAVAQLLNFGVLSVLWDAFEPVGCDVHSAGYSQVRETFLKLMRPGLDYRKAFDDFAGGIIKRRVDAAMQREEDKRGGMSRDEREELLKEVNNRVLKNFALSKDQLATLLLQMGVAMKPVELRTLIDAFDANGDGQVTSEEFLQFTGPKRDKNGGSLAAVSQRCCWMTTCRVTGMANAYCISNATKKALKRYQGGDGRRSQEGSKMLAEDQSGAEETGRIVIRELATGEKRMCCELPDRVKREDLLRRYGVLKGGGEDRGSKDGGQGVRRHRCSGGSDTARSDSEERRYEEKEEDEEDGAKYEDEDFDKYDHDDDGDQDQGGGSRAGEEKKKKMKDELCAAARWTHEDRRKGVLFLEDVSRDARQEETLRALLTQGKPPLAPKLWLGNLSGMEDLHGEEATAPGTALLVCWGPGKSDSVSFFSLEFGGPEGVTRTDKWEVICRDPKDADPDSKMLFCKLVEGLQPGTSYSFRVRGVNGFGPGDYTYRTFTTPPAAPACPRAIRISSDSVTLRWVFSETFFKRIAELKRIFELADGDGTGTISREELTAVLADKASESPSLQQFLVKAAEGIGLDISQGYGALFDMIEGDDDGGLSWPEFEAFFMNAGWTSAGMGSRSIVGSIRASMSALGGTAGASSSQKPGDITFIVERCESELQEVYREVMRTSGAAGQATITRLEPGKSYRFRVFAVNVDGIPGPRSPSIVVHTLLETPPAPVPKALGPHKVVISWKAREKIMNVGRKDNVMKMLGDWAGSHGDEDGGVSVEAAFATYDKDQSGTIDVSELALLLEDLGVEVTEERVRDAFTAFDKNGDGVISFEEFSEWWRRDEVYYILKRSESILPITSLQTMGVGDADAVIDPDTTGRDMASVMSSSSKRLQRPRSAMRGPRLSTIAEEPSGALSARSAGGRSTSTSRLRPAGTSTAKGMDAGGGKKNGAVGAVRDRQVALPIVSYKGTRTKCEVAGLEPNRLYQFKLRYLGPKSSSQLSPPLSLMTLPLAPPSPPLPVALSSTVVRLKAYPPDFGCFKFLFQLKRISGSTSSVGVSNRALQSRASLAAGDTFNTASGSMVRGTQPINVDVEANGWVTVYNGPETVCVCTTLTPDSDYQSRVIAVNCQGNVSEPSKLMPFITLPRADTSDQLTPKNATSTFTIECTGDICVGDTILVTERLFAKSSGSAEAGASGTRGSAGRLAGGASMATIRMDMSVTSLQSNVNAAAPGAFLGERTIAAYVIKDNYRSVRDRLAMDGISPKDVRKFGKHRRLWLEVVWQRSTTEACKPYDLKPGTVIERMQAHLEQFEVFRCPWKYESRRQTLAKEWASLSECYVQLDC